MSTKIDPLQIDVDADFEAVKDLYSLPPPLNEMIPRMIKKAFIQIADDPEGWPSERVAALKMYAAMDAYEVSLAQSEAEDE